MIDPNTSENIDKWKNPPFDIDTLLEIEKLEKENSKILEDSFYKNLDFGTGGLRGIMGIGPNRLNKYTIGRTTQGLANYLKKSFPKQEIKVAIAYDVRHNSDIFSKLTADILSANNIKVFIFESFRPTPELSFSVKNLNCNAGIVITASHNPPEYNGYKIYWQDGGQIVFPQDKEIKEEIDNVDYSEINFDPNKNLISKIGEDIDSLFVGHAVKNTNFNAPRNNIKIVFTPIHGTSYKCMLPAFKKAGFDDVHSVNDQMIPNGDFPTVKSPNPEDPESLQLAINLAKKENADILIGTDPDGDRFGIGIRNNKGEIELLNGNQTNAVLTYFLLINNKLTPDRCFIGSTFVSSDIQMEIAKHFGIECKLALTGFKWIGEMVKKEYGKKSIICGGEESYGFMVGDFVRDKDSITSTLLACEIVSLAKQNNTSFYDILLEVYQKFGFYKEDLLSITKEGKSGISQIYDIMREFRQNPMSKILGEKIIKIDDFQTSISTDLETNSKTKINIPKSNVLIFYTKKGTKVAIRPSGTEPKIKFYFGVRGVLNSKKEFEKVNQILDNKLIELKKIFI